MDPATPAPLVRLADTGDVPAIRRFGEEHIPPHYTPLIGPVAAQRQITAWWNDSYLSDAVADRLVMIAEAGGGVVGVGQRGTIGDDHVVWKLYIHPSWRGHGLGPRLLAALTGQLPPGTGRLFVEHFAANERAGAFYEREGFTVSSVEPSRDENPARAQVWRVLPVPSCEK